MIIFLYLCLCRAFVLVYIALFVIYIYAAAVPSLPVPSLPVYLAMLWICATPSSRLHVGLALVLVLFMLSVLFVWCRMSVDRAFEPIEGLCLV